jgi:GTP-binding protein YchF
VSLKIGIVGLPNVGKSTLFNALVGEQLAQVANFPFCTIEPNLAIVPLPDERLDQLAAVTGVPEKIPATIEFLDVAGLIKGASHGEGLGNQFLGNIRNVQAILHVVRCFESDQEPPSPTDDIGIINTELALADYQQTEKLIEKLSRQIKGDANLKPQYDLAIEIKDHLSEGVPLWKFSHQNNPIFEELNRNLQFLTAKKVIYIANVAEDGLTQRNEYASAVEEIALAEDAEAITICADLEQGMHALSPEEQKEYLDISGISQTGLDKVIRSSYRLLGLISFFTFNAKEARAWTIKEGWTAPMAAGQIHTDFETGFIRAEVSSFSDFVEYGGWAALKSAGVSRSEGRNYHVKDGEVILFRFNV